MLQHLKSREDWSEKTLGAKGFTLIELLVVVIILGILAAVVVLAVGGTTENSRKAACKTEAKTAKTAILAYNAADPDGNTWPQSYGELKTDTRTTPTGLAGKNWVSSKFGYVEINGGAAGTFSTTKPTLDWKSTAPQECKDLSTAVGGNAVDFTI